MAFVANYEYCDLLKDNAAFHVKVQTGKANYKSVEHKELQSRLLQIELRISSQDIISHAAYCFPRICPE